MRSEPASLTGGPDMHLDKLMPARRRVSPGLLRSIWLLFGLLTAFGAVGPACAQSQCPTPNGPGQEPNLTINTICTVSQPGTYNYGDINIVSGGFLIFQEPDAANTRIVFFASSIVVEANGVLQIGGYDTLTALTAAF
jgi:hypothetical protein